MDSVDPIRAAINKQGAVLGRHEQTLTSLVDQCNAISEKQEEILTRLSEISEPNPPVPPIQPGPLLAPTIAHPRFPIL